MTSTFVVRYQSVDEQLQSKQHLLDEIAEMGHSLAEEAVKKEDQFLIDDKVSRLKDHWQAVAKKSTDWKVQIDFMMEEWRRYLELREELLQWTRKSEASLERDDNLYGYTVSELEEQIEKHKVRLLVSSATIRYVSRYSSLDGFLSSACSENRRA